MDRPATSPRWAVAACVAVVGGLLATALVMGRRLWFFSDDWNILVDYHSGHLLEPFNGHLSLLPAGVYQALFHTAGVGSYLPYRLVGLVALGVLGFQVARYGLERAPAPVAVLGTAAVLWNAFGSTNVLFPFLMNFSLPIAALVAIWWHLDRDRPGHDMAAGAWLAVALASSGLGVMALAAVVVELALTRAPWRRWAVFAPATLVWLGWWLGHREANEISADIPAVLSYLARMVFGGFTALGAGNRVLGAVLAAAFAALIAVAVRRGTFGPRALGALAAAGSFAGLTAVTRLDVVPPIPPDELRYGWTIGAYLVLAALSMWPTPQPVVAAVPAATQESTPPSGSTASAPGLPARVAVAAIALGALVVIWGGVRLVDGMARWTDQVADAAPGLRSVLYATEAAGDDRVEKELVLPLSFVPVTAGGYLDAVADVGSPLAGASTAEIGGRADQREDAAALFFAAAPPSVSVPSSAEGVRGPGCAAELTAAPGDRVWSVTEQGPEAADPFAGRVSVSRFDDRPSWRSDDPAPTVAVELAEDAAVGTDAEVPYLLRAGEGTLLCPG